MRYLPLLLLISCATPPPPPPPPPIDFRGELKPHGEFIVVAPWGRGWHPNPLKVGTDFVPYSSAGQWVHTARGWVFDSKWGWGDFVFQHGHWLYLRDYDWLWFEDGLDVPAAVQWRVGSVYVGWAPVPPVASKKGGPASAIPEVVWTYVKARHFMQPDVARFQLPHDEALKAAQQTEASATGPSIELIVAEGGLVSEPDAGYHVPELPVPGSEPLVEPAPVVAPEPEAASEPVKKKPVKKKKTAKKK